MPDIPLPKPAPPLVPPVQPTGPVVGQPLPSVVPPAVSPAQQLTQQPTSSSQPVVSPLPTSQSPTPLVPNTPTTQAPAVLPPASVGALSSLSSNSLPQAGGKPAGGIPQSTQANTPGPAGGAQTTQSTQKSPAPQFAKSKNPILKFLPFILGGVVLLIVGGFVIFQFLGNSGSTSIPPSGTTSQPPGSGGSAGGSTGTTASGEAITLEYWGLWEPAEVMTEVFSDFESSNPGVQIRYTKQSHRDYRERLQTAIASGNGPDLFRFHATWTSTLSEELAPMPNSVYTTAEFQQTFYPVASEQLQSNGQIVGIPLMYDGLALYYNKKMFETAGEQPPTTWVELRNSAKKLTLTSGGSIERGGVALGSSKNVEHFSDIIAYLMLQNGADLRKPNSPETRDAISFYTNFLRTDKVWSETLPNSSVAFAREDVAMIFAPSWRAHEIMAMNPDLEFGILPLPKLADEQIGWANYWAEGVNSKGKNKQAAWNLLKYLSSKEVQQKLHSEQSKVRAFGELYSRRDLANELVDVPYAEAYLQSAPYAEGWYLSSNTFDKGVNDQMIKYYEDAITASSQGKSIDSILQTLELGTTQVLRQYNATGTN